MKNQIVVFVIVLTGFFLINSASDAQTILWAKKGISEGFENGNAIAADDSGNVYVTGQIEFTSVFDSYSLKVYGQHDIIIAKYNTNGIIQWIKKAGGKSGDIGNGIGIDKMHNVYVTGEFEDTAKFGNGIELISAGANDGFIVKYDIGGNAIWAKRFGTTFSEKGRALAVSPNGDCYITGNFSGTSDFGPFSLSSNGGNDIFVAKVDANGNFRWAKKAGGGHQDRGYGIAIDKNENIFVTGTFTSPASFSGVSISNTGNNSTFLAKYNPSGSLEWVKEAGNCCDTTKSNAITLDHYGNIYLAGYFFDATQFDSYNLNSSGVTDVFVVKYDPAGNVVWAKKAGGSDEDAAYGIVADTLNHLIYVTGLVRVNGNFGSLNYSVAGYKDVFIAAYDFNGKEKWVELDGGQKRDVGLAITVDNNGYIYSTGLFNDVATFGSFTLTGYPNQPWADFYVNKIQPPVASLPIIQAAGLSVTPVNCHDLSLSFTAGDGTRRIVIAREGLPVNVNPLNGQNYHHDHIFGNGNDFGNGNFAVYNGESDNLIVSGLTPGMTYYFSVFEYNGWGMTSIYQTLFPATASGTSQNYSINISGHVNSICEGEIQHLTASGAATYLWSPSVGLSSTSGNIVQAQPAITTSYTVNGITSDGCPAENNFIIEVNPLPSVSFSMVPSVCLNDAPIQLTSGSPSGGVYSGNGISGNQFDPHAAGQGIHLLNYAYTDMNGCSSIATERISVKPIPGVSLSTLQPLCETDLPVLLSTGLPAGGVYSGTGVTGNYFYPSTGQGSYRLYYTFTNSSGCNVTTSVWNHVKSSPSVSLGSDLTICTGSSTIINAGSGYQAYQWNDGSMLSSISVDSSGTGFGTKIVSVEVSNFNGCKNTDTVLVTFDLCSGIANSDIEEFIKIFPNPFKGSYTVSSSKTISIYIYDVCGRLLEKSERFSGTLTTGQNYSPGLYIMEVFSGNTKKVFSIIKSE